METITIDKLPQAGTIGNDDQFLISQENVTKKVSAGKINDFVNPGTIPEGKLPNLATTAGNVTTGATQLAAGTNPIKTILQRLIDNIAKAFLDISTKAAASDLTAAATRITTIEDKIPNQATSTNQLADKNFVNSIIIGSTGVPQLLLSSPYPMNSGANYITVDQWTDKIVFGFPSQAYFGSLSKVNTNVIYALGSFIGEISDSDRKNTYDYSAYFIIPKNNKNAFCRNTMFKFYPGIFDRVNGVWREDVNKMCYISISGDRTYDSYHISLFFGYYDSLKIKSNYTGTYLGNPVTVEVEHVPSLRFAGMWTVPLEVSE